MVGTPVKVEVARARAYARMALAIDPNNGEAYAVLGELATETKMKNAAPQIAAALADLRRAIALDPSNGSAHEWYGVTLLDQGRVGEAYSELRTAAQLDPLSVRHDRLAWHDGLSRASLSRRHRLRARNARSVAAAGRRLRDARSGLRGFWRRRASRQTFRKLAQACATCRAEAAALLAALDAHANHMAAARAELAIAQAHAKDVAARRLGRGVRGHGEPWRGNHMAATLAHGQ